MLLPRFSIRTFLTATAGFAVVFLIVGAAVRGGTWGWGITIGIASLAVTALVHAAYFGIIYFFAQLPSARQAAERASPPEAPS